MFCVLTTTESRVVATGKLYLSSRVTSAADCSYVVVLLFFNHCLLLLPLFNGALCLVLVL